MFFTSELGKGFIISDEEEVWLIHILHIIKTWRVNILEFFKGRLGVWGGGGGFTKFATKKVIM